MTIAELARALPWRKFAPRAVLGVALAMVAASSVLILSRADPTVGVLVAGQSLQAGQPVSQLELVTKQVASADGLIESVDRTRLSEWVLTTPLEKGEPLLRSVLSNPEQVVAGNQFALELPESRAVLGRLAAGDHIDIYATFASNTGGEAPAARLLAAGVYVIEAHTNETGLGGEQMVQMIVAVNDALALDLAGAVNNAELNLVKQEAT